MDTWAWVQIIIALIVGLGVFIALYLLPARWTVTVLVVLIPFQIIDSKYGSMNTVLTYMLAGAFLLQHRLNKAPLIGVFALIGLVYMLAMSQVPAALRFGSILYLFSISSGFLMFYVIYNTIRSTRDIHYFMTLLVIINVMVTLYCYIQLAAGGRQIAMFGVQEFALTQNRITEMDRRLAGPFSAVGITAEFLVIQILLMGYLAMHMVKRSRRWLLYGLIIADLAFLVATGNRGGVISLVIGSIIMLIVFRKELGGARLLVAAIGGLGLFIAVGIVVIQTTEFDLLYERFVSTEFRGVMPETRSDIWTETIERIAEKPIIGHGPRVQFDPETLMLARLDWITGHPHNLYLFLLYTVGIVGLVAYLVLFAGIFRRLWQARSYRFPDKLVQGLPKLGIVLVVVFLIDQIKVEFLRFTLADYQQYMFSLWGFLLAAAAVLRQEARTEPSAVNVTHGSINDKAAPASQTILRPASRRMPE
jgi:hypothetical protein